jgi:hypothetical protein
MRNMSRGNFGGNQSVYNDSGFTTIVTAIVRIVEFSAKLNLKRLLYNTIDNNKPSNSRKVFTEVCEKQSESVFLCAWIMIRFLRVLSSSIGKAEIFSKLDEITVL